MSAKDVEYGELTVGGVSSRTVDDLNALLVQLSSKPNKLTLEWANGVLAVGTRVFTASFGGHIIGILQLSPVITLVRREDWINGVVVDERFRRQGISTRLMDLAEAASAAGPAKSINLTSKRVRGDARAMYTARGYSLRDSDLFRQEH